jgi:transaldolase/glucose-6-phosphate isomerase
VKSNPLLELQKYGQSFWIDYISRHLLSTGELARLIEQDGLRGVTSNPTIFAQAISRSHDYDEEMAREAREGKEASAVYEALVTKDVRLGCDILRPVYESSGARDGFVSLEVNPNLAHDTEGTIIEAMRLFALVSRPNLMIKVPATKEGVPAVERLIAAGININITLMFSLEHYEPVADAYMRGLERRVRAGRQVGRVASVASLFVSRVDKKVDELLDARIRTSPDEAEREALRSLLGRAAIANAKVMYRKFKALFGVHDRWRRLSLDNGSRVQRLLWASTSAKNPAYPDTYYVEALIGPDTVDTMPPQTIDAFRDHGRVAPTLEEGLDDALETLDRLTSAGIDLRRVTEELQEEGVASFAKSFDELMAALGEKREAVYAHR